MKTFKMIFLVICIFFTESMIFGTTTVKLATGEWDPYTTEKTETKGFVTEIISAAFLAVNIQPVYVFLPWKRCESNLDNGTVFGIFPYVSSPERIAHYIFSDKIAFSTGRFFYKKDKFKNPLNYENLTDLKNYSIGGTLGYWYEKDFTTAGLKTEYVAGDELNFRKLLGDRVDAVVADELVGWELIKKIDAKAVDTIATMQKPLNRSELHIMVSKKYPDTPEILKQFNSGLEIIKKNGIYKKILVKYNIKE